MVALKVVAVAFALLASATDTVSATATVSSRQLRAVAVDTRHTKIHDPDAEIINNKTGETYDQFATRVGDHESGEWSYADAHAWASYGNPFCDGSYQSPIDIVDSKVTSGDFLQQSPAPAPGPATGSPNTTAPATTVVLSDRTSALGRLSGRLEYLPLANRYVANYGYNIQVNGDFGTFKLPNGLYDVVLLNFHFPSEHTFDGKHMSGEMHIVHRQKNTEGTGSLAVVAILFQEWHYETLVNTPAEQERKSELDFLSNLGFGSSLPSAGEELPVKGPVDIMTAYKRVIDGGFYHYVGSLTTPPCTENVHWYVMKYPAMVTPEMVASFKAIFPDPANNRPVQALHNRQVVFNRISEAAEYGIEHDDYGFHSDMHEISEKEAEYHVTEAHVGAEVQEHHGQMGDLGPEFHPKPDFAPPPHAADAHDTYPSDTGTPHDKAPRAGASRVSVDLAMMLTLAGLLRM